MKYAVSLHKLMEDHKPLVWITRQSWKDVQWTIHAADCQDVQREIRNNAGLIHKIPVGITPEAYAKQDIDDLNRSGDWDSPWEWRRDVKIYPCCYTAQTDKNLRIAQVKLPDGKTRKVSRRSQFVTAWMDERGYWQFSEYETEDQAERAVIRKKREWQKEIEDNNKYSHNPEYTARVLKGNTESINSLRVIPVTPPQER